MYTMLPAFLGTGLFLVWRTLAGRARSVRIWGWPLPHEMPMLCVCVAGVASVVAGETLWSLLCLTVVGGYLPWYALWHNPPERLTVRHRALLLVAVLILEVLVLVVPLVAGVLCRLTATGS
jgi:hypothetical protein